MKGDNRTMRDNMKGIIVLFVVIVLILFFLSRIGGMPAGLWPLRHL